VNIAVEYKQLLLVGMYFITGFAFITEWHTVNFWQWLYIQGDH